MKGGSVEMFDSRTGQCIDSIIQIAKEGGSGARERSFDLFAPDNKKAQMKAFK